jgi:Holliday junction DNA helicase RuvA
MYAFIKGKIIDLNPAYVVLETSGVGYQLQISLNTFAQIKEKEDCSLFTHLAVREDAHLLYGFYDEEERKLFRQLIGVSGVGNSTAMLILSAYSSEELVTFIVNGEVDRLKSVKGIGAKTAQRIIVDLKDRFDKGEITLEKLGLKHNTIKEEALSGLAVLGFNKRAAEKAVQQVLKSAQDHEEAAAVLSVETLIKEALKLL